MRELLILFMQDLNNYSYWYNYRLQIENYNKNVIKVF